MELDHIGMATTQADELARLFEEILDASVAHEEESHGIHFIFLDIGPGYFELIEPLEEDTDIGRYIEENGEGMHHVGIETDDLPAALDTAREAGVDLIDEEPRPGAWGHEIAFLDPESTGGILVEYFSYPD